MSTILDLGNNLWNLKDENNNFDVDAWTPYMKYFLQSSGILKSKCPPGNIGVLSHFLRASRDCSDWQVFGRCWKSADVLERNRQMEDGLTSSFTHLLKFWNDNSWGTFYKATYNHLLDDSDAQDTLKLYCWMNNAIRWCNNDDMGEAP